MHRILDLPLPERREEWVRHFGPAIAAIPNFDEHTSQDWNLVGQICRQPGIQSNLDLGLGLCCVFLALAGRWEIGEEFWWCRERSPGRLEGWWMAWMIGCESENGKAA